MNIGNISMSSFGAPPRSPREDMDGKIDAAVEAGALSEVDATALEAALDNIDTALKSSSSTSSGQKPLDPSEMKSRVDSLIAEQVDNGTLTDEQASELQMFFAAGPGGPGGPPPPPPMDASSETAAASSEETLVAALTESAATSTSSSSTSDSASSTSETSTETDKLALLEAFLDSLRAAEADRRGTYGPQSSGQRSDSSAGQVVNQYI